MKKNNNEFMLVLGYLVLSQVTAITVGLPNTSMTFN